MNSILRTRRTAIKLCRPNPVIIPTRRPTIEPFAVQRHPRFVKRINAVVALAGLLALFYIGYQIYRGYQLGNPAFRLVAERVSRAIGK